MLTGEFSICVLESGKHVIGWCNELVSGHEVGLRHVVDGAADVSAPCDGDLAQCAISQIHSTIWYGTLP